MAALITEARGRFHATLCESGTLAIDEHGIATNADKSQRFSCETALSIASSLGARTVARKLDGQRAGRMFEAAVEQYVRDTFLNLGYLRPGKWRVENVGGSRAEYQIAQYVPFKHLDELANAVRESPTLAAVLGNSYSISPDVLVLRSPEADADINRSDLLVDFETARRTPVRAENQGAEIVHAVISCKWTLRSDRAQNARSEALNIIRNRKGRTPHIVVVTGEPSPSRIASLALGTGDLDTVYHFALPELIKATLDSDNDEAHSILTALLDGERLRDISDLPLDLAL